jgi:hypothetical protein
MENSQALATAPDSPLALMPVMSVEQAVQRYKMMVEVVQDLLREGTDFGKIPGTEKPTLLKPGAEKLCTFFGLQPHAVLLESMEDWENGFFYYRYQCQLKRGNYVIAAAEGSANSREKKYRWRKVPEFKATKEEKANAARREELTGKGGRPYVMLTIENSEPFDLVNTLQKMAQKRAHIASTLLAVNASEFFTQDLEDFVDAHPDTAPAEPRNGKTTTAAEKALNDMLLAHCVQQKGDKNGEAYFNAMYAKKSPAEKAAIIKELRLTTSAPQPEAEAAPVIEGEVVETEAKPLGPDHGNVLDLIEALKEAGQSYDAVNAKIAALCGGVYAVEELDDAQAAKAASALSKWHVELKQKGVK